VISATADSNIYISGLRSAGPASRFLYIARTGQIRLDISDEILGETIGVLREKFSLPGELLHHIREQITGFTHRVTPTDRLDVIKEDPDDNMVLECAQAAGSHYIVSFDHDLLRLEQFGRIRIIKPSEILDVVLLRGERR